MAPCHEQANSPALLARLWVEEPSTVRYLRWWYTSAHALRAAATDLFEAINRVMESYPQQYVFGDIGCYTLGASPPYNTISTCVDMGASITMAKGAADAGLHPALCVIGDSTFTHSGITGLMDAVNDNSPLTVIISDNDTTAMTGGQDSAGSGRYHDICKGVGVTEAHIRTIVPLKKNLEENIKVLKEELEYKGVSVIISQRECVQTLKKRNKMKRSERSNR